MGTPWSNDERKKAKGIAVASQELSGRDEQVDAMVCDPPTASVPSNSGCTAGDDKENCKERVNWSAPSEKNAGWLPESTSFSNGMFNNAVDGRFQSGFSRFASFLQRFPAGEENNFQAHRNYSLVALVTFLEGREADIVKAASQQIAELDTSYRSEVTLLTGKHEQQVLDCESHSQGKKQELSRDLEKVSKELSDALTQLRSTGSSLNSAQSEIQDRSSAVQVMQAQLEEETRQKQELSKHRDSIRKDMNAQRVDFDNKLRHSQEAKQAKEREVNRLNSVIVEKEKAVRNKEAVTSQLNTECKKLKDQLATIEKKTAQESLTSGSYTEGHANPSMFVSACQGVDNATDSLVRFLHENSITGKCSPKTSELESFVCKISTARPADFPRPAQVKHVWGHWICSIMFQDFEHVFFNTGLDRTSPLDSKKHAMECYQTFQQNKDSSPRDYCKACPMFQAYCFKTYGALFPLKLVNEALQLDSLQIISSDSHGRFDGDGELYLRFLDVAKAIWLLHELSLSFDPPATILRIGWGTPFDKQYHESLIKDEEDKTSSQVVLVYRPAFRVRNTVIKSRVFLSKKST